MKADFNTVSFALPAKRIPVEKWDSVAGRKFTRDIKKGRIITWADVDLNEDK
jgi:predicted homoserine dehydrogenase-like protein